MKQIPLLAGLAACVLLGIGCNRQTSPSAPMSHVPTAPKDAWAEFQAATPVAGTTSQTLTDTADQRAVVFDIPNAWHLESGAWRPEASSTSYIRASYFATMGTETEWTKQQGQTDIQDVVHAEKQGNTYILLVNQKTLNVSLFKMFHVDPEHPDKGFFFVECRVPYEAANRDQLWGACKQAAQSAQFNVLK